MTQEQRRMAWREGQTFFWVARPELTEFFNIGKHPTHKPLHAEPCLPFGTYVLGCGYGRCKLRKLFRVDLMGVRWL
jgi:hypothetical protein